MIYISFLSLERPRYFQDLTCFLFPPDSWKPGTPSHSFVFLALNFSHGQVANSSF
uniref:Macaca fascicularis brain cDNA, clone: QflA-21030 n=1 Tax=Macaca fascicularis TaxID=9541 RepID=I7G6R2_MACFA|nr:unnamed protein product [Macaca fascicularis]